MEHKRYLTAGEFAKITGTTKHTLFHYDAIGLFAPQYRAENGYRYYSVEQLEIFDVIITLRELDMPLEQIKQYLHKRSPGAFLDLLTQERKLINAKIAMLKKTEAWLEDKTEQLEQVMHMDLEQLECLKIPEQYFIQTHCPLGEDVEVAEKISHLYTYCEENNCKSPYNVGYIQYSDTLRQELYEEYHTIYLLFDRPPKGVTYQIKPAGSYLCAYHKGHWKNIKVTYQKLFAYSEQFHLNLDSAFYEDYLLDELTVDGPDHYVTRISVRILEQENGEK